MSEPSCEFDPIDDLADVVPRAIPAGRAAVAQRIHGQISRAGRTIRAVFPALIVMEEVGAGRGRRRASMWSRSARAPRWLGRLGDFVLIRRVGSGGMGIVYEAEHESLKSRVALKVMHPRFRADQTYVRRSKPGALRGQVYTIPTSCRFSAMASRTGSATTRCSISWGLVWSGYWDDVRRLRGAASGVAGQPRAWGTGRRSTPKPTPTGS